MSKSSFPKAINFDDEVTYCLEYQMIPTWERHGVDRLSVGAETLSEFRKQLLPEQVSAWRKKREGKSAPKRKRIHRGSRVLKSWPDEDQFMVRFPVLIYVRSGQAEYQVGDYVIQCPQGHFLLLPPGMSQSTGKMPHLEEPRLGKQCEIWRFNTTGSEDYVTMSVCYSKGEEHKNSGHYYIVNDRHATQLLHIFSQEIASKSPYYKKAGFATLQAFLHVFLREIKAERFYNRGVDNLPKLATPSASAIEMAQQYIDKNLNHSLTIDIVAQAVFMARTSFTRKFREETGKTFSQYLTERRLEQAKHWLSQDSCSIGAVCQFVGLKHSRLHQLFRQYFGMTPSQFRKKQGEDKKLSNIGT